MGQVQRKFEVVEGGFPNGHNHPIGKPIGKPLGNSDLWIDADALAALSNISVQMARKAIRGFRWRSADLEVRRVEVGRGGAGGFAMQVHVDSLPADLRTAWYAGHGIQLHEKVDAETGQVVMVPEAAYQNDAQHEADLKVARWRMELIRPVLAQPKQSAARAALIYDLSAVVRLMPNGTRKALTKQTIYNWVVAVEAEGLHGLIRKRREDKGEKRFVVTGAWDAFFADHIKPDAQTALGDALTHYIRSLWGSGERGWRQIAHKSTTRLIELSRDLRVVAFDALPLGRLGDTTRHATQFGICSVHRRIVEAHRSYGLLAIKAKDNAVYQDNYMPSIRRDYSTLLPRQIVVGDVHPVDIMMRRTDGSVVYPKAISWYDPAVNAMHMTFVLLAKGEGVRREHVAQSFEAMVDEWGLPEMLYLDNGMEYSWDAMIGGFTQLSKLSNGMMKVFDQGGDAAVTRRVLEGKEALARSLPYNAKGKPGIEGAFGNLEQVFFATMEGWTAGERMRKKTHMKGRDPIAYPGDASAFLDDMSRVLDWYHKTPQGGKLGGRSPNEALAGFIEGGWGKTVLSGPEVLALAFSDVLERMPDRGRVSYTPRTGNAIYFYDDALLGIDHKITLRVPAFNPEYVFCFDGDTYLCQAFPERSYAVFDRAGAEELSRRGSAMRRQISERKRHVSLLSLTDETARHITHLPDTPEAPVAAVVDAGILDRLAQLAATDRAAAKAEDDARRAATPFQQWKTGPVKAVDDFEFAEEDAE